MLNKAGLSEEQFVIKVDDWEPIITVEAVPSMSMYPTPPQIYIYIYIYDL